MNVSCKLTDAFDMYALQYYVCLVVYHGLVRSGQCLTCTFRTSCCSTRLSWAQLLHRRFLCPGQAIMDFNPAEDLCCM